MTGSEIIAAFEQYVDDTTELSSAEELALLNKWYQKVCDSKLLEVLKKEATGTMTSTTTITLPSDFAYLVENYNWTDNSISTQINSKPTVVWITNGGSLQPFQLVNWSDRRQYLNTNGYCYIDLANNVIRFPYAQSSGATYSYDYKAVPANLSLATSPVFPTRFHPMLYHLMAADDMVVQLFPKANSYREENLALAKSYSDDLSLYNANLQNN